MPHLHRFYIPPDTEVMSGIALPEAEAHHARRVLRLKEDEKVALFDGQGREWLGEVLVIDRKEVRIAVRELYEAARPTRELILAQAWLNHEKNVEEIVRRGTDLGVARFLFFKGEHSERPPKTHDKWTRIAIESCKQTGRLWLPEYGVIDHIETALKQAEGTILLASLEGERKPLREALDGKGPVMLFVGPEGDFSATELERAVSAGAIPVSLGDYTLRSELAATVAVSLIQYELGNMGPLA